MWLFSFSLPFHDSIGIPVQIKPCFQSFWAMPTPGRWGAGAAEMKNIWPPRPISLSLSLSLSPGEGGSCLPPPARQSLAFRVEGLSGETTQRRSDWSKRAHKNETKKKKNEKQKTKQSINQSINQSTSMNMIMIMITIIMTSHCRWSDCNHNRNHNQSSLVPIQSRRWPIPFSFSSSSSFSTPPFNLFLLLPLPPLLLPPPASSSSSCLPPLGRLLLISL